jgi:hypothetical protein
MDPFGLFMLGAAVIVGIVVGLVVRLVQLIVERIRGRPFLRTTGWRAALAWTLGFATAAFAAAGVFSIGFFVLPVAVIVCVVAAWFCRGLPEGFIGASLGTGSVLWIIGLMNPTPQPGRGVDGTSWLPLAIALIVVALSTVLGSWFLVHGSLLPVTKNQRPRTSN